MIHKVIVVVVLVRLGKVNAIRLGNVCASACEHLILGMKVSLLSLHLGNRISLRVHCDEQRHNLWALIALQLVQHVAIADQLVGTDIQAVRKAKYSSENLSPNDASVTLHKRPRPS